MIGKDEEVELPELDKILTKYMTGESKRPLWPYLTEALQKCLIPLRRRRRQNLNFDKFKAECVQQPCVFNVLLSYLLEVQVSDHVLL